MAKTTTGVEVEDDTPCLGDFFISREYTTKVHELGAIRQAIDSLASASTDFDLTGQIVWLVSILTGWYAGTILEELRGKDVLELGAGAGMTGLVASQASRRCVLTDYEPEVLSLLELNLKHAGGACDASVFSLSWGDAGDHARLASTYGRARWPVLIGADIVYWSESIVPLFATVEALLDRDGVFILGYFNRNGTNKVRVEELAASAGLTWVVVDPLSFLPTDPVPPAFEPSLGRMTLYRFTWAPGRGPPV